MRFVQTARPKRKQKRIVRRLDYQRDKKLYRLPAPFYRASNMAIVAGPGAEKIVLYVFRITQLVLDGPARGTAHVFRGWLVKRTNALHGYYLDNDNGFQTLGTVTLAPDAEGSLWARGWDEETFQAICATVAMS